MPLVTRETCDAVRAAVGRRLRSVGLDAAPAASAPEAPPSSRAQKSTAIFGAPLTAVSRLNIKCCGEQFLVPTFVHEACTMLKSHLFIEGLFRKAGSQSRQREIKRALESGRKIDKSHHAIDIASILKQYLRTLPEPLIKNELQEILLRCLLLPENIRLCAINLALLLMPISHLHILHYIMEFFKCVALKCDLNKMDTNNLAIVIAPTIIPPPLSCPPQRMDHHVKLVKIFIENSNMIGIIPDDLCLDEEDVVKEVQKKKKRRSGSLTRMLTSLRKIVTNNGSKPTNTDVMATPILDKGQSKRKQQESLGFSAKKRKEILESLPNHATATPIKPIPDKEHKRLRLSIGRKAKVKVVQNAPEDIINKDNHYNGILDKLEKANCDLKSHISSDFMEIDLSDHKDSDYVKIPKSEYEAIKNRVSAIENRISQEFNVFTGIESVQPVHQVQSAYEKTLEEAAMLSSPGSEQIARRRSRELKIRQSGEHKIIRSPSARKIGIIRRRSRDNTTKLTRTQTWSISSQTSLQNDVNNKTNQFYTSAGLKRGRPNTINTGLLQPNPTVMNSVDKRLLETKRRGSFDDSFHIRSPSVNNDILVNRNFSPKNRSKRPSSFHGHIDSVKPVNKPKNVIKDINIDNNVKWQNAQSYLLNLESLDNPLTGRASVAKLRNQMAGMVLAKARLFDGLSDSDSSLEKKINVKPVRQVSSFARKSRKCISPEKQAAHYTSDEFSPTLDTKLSKKAPYKSPGLVSKRHKTKITRSPLVNKKSKENLNLSTQLKDVIYDVCTPLSEKVNKDNNTPLQRIKEISKSNGGFKSPRSTPHMKKSLGVKTAGGLKSQNNVDVKKVNTPIRVNHITPRRQSPRLLSMKTRQLA